MKPGDFVCVVSIHEHHLPRVGLVLREGPAGLGRAPSLVVSVPQMNGGVLEMQVLAEDCLEVPIGSAPAAVAERKERAAAEVEAGADAGTEDGGSETGEGSETGDSEPEASKKPGKKK